MHTLESLFPYLLSPTNYVYVIQEDIARPGNVIIGVSYSLLSLSLADNSSGILIAGNATGNLYTHNFLDCLLCTFCILVFETFFKMNHMHQFLRLL